MIASRKTPAALAGAIAFALVAAACGSDGSASDSTPSSTQVPTSTTTSTTGEVPDSSAPAGTEAPEVTEPAPEDPSVTSTVAGTLEEPIVLLARPGDDGHLWVAERAGTVRRVAIDADGNLDGEGTVAIDISDQVTTDVERGLLGMAFSPGGETLYLSFSDPNGDTAVTSYAVAGDAADRATEDELFAIEQPFANHNGGNIVTGPDELLWLGLGDGGAADDPDNRAQDPTTELGKIITIDPASGDTDIVVSGVRNPWRFAFDTDGTLWIGDVGQNATEEVDRLGPDEIDGANLGWSGYEGSAEYLDGDGRRPDDAIGPVFEYGRDGGNCSITGGFVYRGSALQGLDGAYLFADYCAGDVRAISITDDGALAAEWDLGVSVANPISFGADQAGEPYVLSAEGDIVRLVPAS